MTDSILRSYQTYTQTSVVPFPVTIVSLLLNTYAGATAAYSFRKLDSSYAGSAVRIRRSSDNAEADIGFSGNDFDAAAAATHIGGGSGFIAKWYDQSGNGIDILHATAANQPTYSASGLSSKPTAQFDGSNSHLLRASTTLAEIFSGTNVTVLSVMLQTGANPNNGLFAWSGADQFQGYVTYGDTIYFDIGSSGAGGRVNVAQPGGWDGNPHVLELYRDVSNEQGIVVDGSSLVTGTRTDTASGSATTWSIGYLTGILFAGSVSEFVVWGTDLGSTNRAGARDDMNDYYAIF